MNRQNNKRDDLFQQGMTQEIEEQELDAVSGGAKPPRVVAEFVSKPHPNGNPGTAWVDTRYPNLPVHADTMRMQLPDSLWKHQAQLDTTQIDVRQGTKEVTFVHRYTQVG
jgi:hypothetical protein